MFQTLNVAVFFYVAIAKNILIYLHVLPGCKTFARIQFAIYSSLTSNTVRVWHGIVNWQ